METKQNGIHRCHQRYPTSLVRRTVLIGAAVLLVAHQGSAFQTTCPTVQQTRGSSSILSMAETSYPFGRETTSFLSPLFQDYNWPRQSPPSSSRRGLLSTSSLIFSSRESFSFLESSNLDDDDDDDDDKEKSLRYLPSGGRDLSPKTRELLTRVTSEYVSKRRPVIDVDEVLDVVDAEYKSRDVSVIVGHETFDFESSGDVDDADVARILSFAAHHRMPRDVALLLFGPTNDGDDDEKNAFVRCRNQLARDSWKQVSFPQGLAIRPKRKYVKSTTGRYMPLPRPWRTSRKEAVRNAQKAVDEASYVEAPPRRLLTREEFLASMAQELSATEPTELLPSILRDARLFFPRQNKKLKRLRRVFKKQIVLLKAAGLAGVMSYLALNFAWYTFAIVAQWRHSTATVEISSRALGTALRRFGKVLAGAYIGSQLTRMLRLKIALALAPFGNRVLRLTQKKLRISETKAFALLSGAVLGTCLAVWSIIVLGDAVVLRSAGSIRLDHVGFEPTI